MSIGSLFHKVWTKLQGFLGSEAKIEHAAAITLTAVEPALDGIIGAVAGSGVESEVQAVIDTINKDLELAQSVLNGTIATPEGGVAGILSGVVSNLGSILQLSGIKDTATASKVTVVVDSATALLQGIIAGVASTQAAPAPASELSSS